MNNPSFKTFLFFVDNLAFNKPTYQQYRYKGLFENITGASNAVDGLRSNLSVFAGQCVISEERVFNATWWVNLTSIFSIHHITIYYRTGNKKWGMFVKKCQEWIFYMSIYQCIYWKQILLKMLKHLITLSCSSFYLFHLK